MYNKEELLSKSISELEDIAKELNVTIKSGASMEDIVYDIIEAQAIDYASKNPMGTKRKRTRITKKDTDRVYSVNGKDGENFDLKKNKTTAEPVPLFKDLPEKPEHLPRNPLSRLQRSVAVSRRPSWPPLPKPKLRPRKRLKRRPRKNWLLSSRLNPKILLRLQNQSSFPRPNLR